jgi:hypothetical protein
MEFVVQSYAPWIDVRRCCVLHKAFCDFELWESAIKLTFRIMGGGIPLGDLATGTAQHVSEVSVLQVIWALLKPARRGPPWP